MVYNGYYKVMSNIPKMGHLPTPERYGQKNMFQTKKVVDVLDALYTPPVCFIFFRGHILLDPGPGFFSVPGFLGDRRDRQAF